MARLSKTGVRYITYVVGNALTSQISTSSNTIDPDVKVFTVK